MTKDTTFKEFVEERGLDFTEIAYNSEQYRELSEEFREAKRKVMEENPETGGCREEGSTD